MLDELLSLSLGVEGLKQFQSELFCHLGSVLQLDRVVESRSVILGSLLVHCFCDVERREGVHSDEGSELSTVS